MSLFARYTELLKSGVADALVSLGASLEPLDRVRSELADQARRYVMDGTDPQLLLELPKYAEAGNWLASPTSHWFSGHGYFGTVPSAIARRSWLDRQDYYRGLQNGTYPTLLLERVGRLLLAAAPQFPLVRLESTLPDWVFVLLQDGLEYRIGGPLWEPGDEPGLPDNLDTVKALVEHAGGGAAELMHLLFERKGCRQGDFYRLQTLNGFKPFLDVESERLEAMRPRLTAAGRQVMASVLLGLVANDHSKEGQAWQRQMLARLAVDESKPTREIAMLALQGLKVPTRIAALQAIADSDFPPAQRVKAVELLAAETDATARAWLAELRRRETNKKILKVLDRLLVCADAVESAVTAVMPEALPYEPVVDGGLGVDVVDVLQQNLNELITIVEAEALQEKAKGNQNHGYAARQLSALRKIEHRDLQSLWRVLNGQETLSNDNRNVELRLLVMPFKNRVATRSDFGLPQILRYVALTRSWQFWANSELQSWLARRADALDLRQLADAMKLLGHSRLAVSVNMAAYGPCDQLPPRCIWPWFAANPELIEEGLGLRQRGKVGSTMPAELGSTLKVLGTFPELPAAWIPRLLQIATGEGRSHRAAARALLSRLPDIGARVLATLTTIAQEARQSALRWLVELDYRAAVSTLRQMLVKETKELLCAELLATLEALGDDISAELSPAKLTAEAAASMTGKIPADVAWFDFERLPSLRWQDGSAVAPVVPRAWVVLAAKFKTPGGNPLLTRYLALLDTGSAAELGSAVLVQFMAHDTRTVSITDAEAYADANVDQRYAMYQQWAKQYPGSNYGDWTREKVHAALKQEKLGTYLGSAIGAKGLLALIARVPGRELVSTINAYMRDHHTRRAQIEALLEGLSQSSDPAAIQLLLAVSRRHRTASVQEKAKLLVADVAERLGWGPEQLADRTIPTAGLDERGEAELDYGARQFQLKLDAELKLALFTADGKPLKALPDARKDEDAARVKEAKTQFSASKKELSQVLSLQTDRLYEAMCAGRRWPLADWRQYLAGHPIVGRLLQRLVWTADADGQSWQFRPSEDGALLDADDEELALPAHAEIGLAHAAVLPAETVKRWLKHLKDYKIKPLFAQLDRPLPPTLAADAEQIADRVGYCADTFGFRGAFTKLGYQRAQAEDGGCFYAYHKPYTGLGLRTVIEFTGSALPETNVAAALRELSFERLGRSSRRVKLAEVPPVLLAEAVADYHKVASIGAFDPQWEQRSPW